MLSTHKLGRKKKSKRASKSTTKPNPEPEPVRSSMLVHSLTGKKAEDVLAKFDIANDPMFRKIESNGVDILFEFEITGYSQCEPFDTLWPAVPTQTLSSK